MANPLTVGLAVLVIAGICVQLAVVLRYRAVRREDDAEAFEKDVEWQLQHELSDAIEASSNNGRRLVQDEMQEATPLLFSSPNTAPHIRFADNQPSSGTWHDFKAYSRTELERLSTATAQTHIWHQTPPLSQQPFLDPPILNHEIKAGKENQPLFINPKQFHRILKRRMTRHLIEEYFRSRTNTQKGSDLHSHGMRRPRGPTGRFLTLEEVERMGVGVVVA